MSDPSISQGSDIVFPEPQDPKVWEYDLEAVYGDLLQDFVEAFSDEDNQELFKLSLYYPYEYFREEVEPPEGFHMIQGRMGGVLRLLRIGFLKSFESSIMSFEHRCNTQFLKCVSWLNNHQIDPKSVLRCLNPRRTQRISQLLALNLHPVV